MTLCRKELGTHRCSLSLGEGNGLQWGGTSCHPHLLGSHLNFHPDLALKGWQRPGSRQAWGASLTSPATPAMGSKTPQRHDCLGLQTASLTPSSGDLHLRVVSKGRASSGRAHQIPVPKSPLQSAGRAGTPRTIRAAIATLLSAITAARHIPQLRSSAITPQALCRQNIHLAIYMICNVKRLSDSSLRTAALAISSVKYFQNPKVLREKSSYFD